MKNLKYERINIPDSLSERVQKGIREGTVIYKKNRRKKQMTKAATAAAAIIVCVCIFAFSPLSALASQVPFIRDIFKIFQADYSYPGDFDAVVEKLGESANNDGDENMDYGVTGNMGENLRSGGSADNGKENVQNDGSAGDGKEPAAKDEKYTKTVDGVTVSVSEAYCSAGAVYMSLIITNEEKFPDTAAYDYPVVCIKTKEKYPFDDEKSLDMGFGYLEGDFLDDYTYAGIYRIDIADITQGDRDKTEKFLSDDTLHMDFTITQIIGDKAEPDKADYQGKTKEELEAMTDEEWKAFMKEVYDESWSSFPNAHENWWYDGPYEFELDLKVDTKNAQIVTVDERNETGAGLHSVSKTLFEITVDMDCTEERLKQGVAIVVLDADGKLLQRGSSTWGSTFAIGDSNVSKIYVYLCDAQDYIDELKRYRESENFREILDENALYSKVIEF